MQERSDPVCASLFDDHVLPKEHPTKGWNRASIIFWSRKPRARLTARDVELPVARGLALLAMCAGAAGLVSVTAGWFVLFIVNLYWPLSGGVVGELLAAVAVVLTVLLYAIAAHRRAG